MIFEVEAPLRLWNSFVAVGAVGSSADLLKVTNRCISTNRVVVPLFVPLRQVASPRKSNNGSTMSAPAAKRQRSADHAESTRHVNVIKGGLSIMCPAVRLRRVKKECDVP